MNKNALPKVMVATQVVEVSLDVDFEQGFFEIAPIDAIIQRMGRVNRSGKRSPANIEIFTRQINKFNLYCECKGNDHGKSCKISRSINELHNLENPISESDLVNAADNVYDTGYQGEDKIKFEEGLNHQDIRNFNDLLLAGACQDWVEKIIEKTDGLLEVLPLNLQDDYESRKKLGLWIEARNLLVPLRTFSLKKYPISKKDDIWIINNEYSKDEGLKDSISQFY
jgi:CRISPR-associated endonuclease/helicase Cas3